MDTLSIYIHIPFCVKRCSYCDFYSTIINDIGTVQKVLDKIIHDIETWLKKVNPRKISTLFIGGGTPSCIPINCFSTFLTALDKLTGPVDELTIEVNPESLTGEFLQTVKTCMRAGTYRISMGVQSYNNNLLTWLGRPAMNDAIHRADELLRTEWSGNVNRDIIAAIPRRQGELFMDLEQALTDNPGHLSLYELTVEPETQLAGDYVRLKLLPNEEFRLTEWKSALSWLSSRGYERYEVSSFAKSGHECRHNMNYWQLKPYLGIGPSAVSTICKGNMAERLTEIPNLLQWLNGYESNREFLTTQNFICEHFLMAWRTSYGLSTTRFMSTFGIHPLQLISRTSEKYIAKGMLHIDNDRLYLCSEGLDILDAILLDVLRELDEQNFKPEYYWDVCQM